MANEMELTLRLLAPLALHQTRAGVLYVKTLDYIPGTALRGALAEAYLTQHGTPGHTFQSLFLSEQVQYGDLWPTIQNEPTALIPVTAHACKRYGIQHESSFRDGLLDALTSNRPDQSCPDCRESLDRVGGGYLQSVTKPIVLKPRSRLRVSTAIERSTGSVAREMLFTQHTLAGVPKDSPQTDLFFRGSLRLADPSLRDKLTTLLKPGTRLFLGSGRSRGLGEVKVESLENTAMDNSLSDRWHKFNDAAQGAGGGADTRYFSLTLLSHLALRDHLLRPVLSEISPQHFALPDGVAWVHYKDSGQPALFLDAITAPGWNAALGLPKPDTVALARGSVLLGQCDASQEDAVLARLAEIEAEGVGERRSEGLGRVAVCYPIHYEQWR